LYKLWNVFAFFFPYLELLDRPWDDVLPGLIPAFWDASDALTYALAVTAAAVRTQDSHTRVHCQALLEHVGVHSPPLAVRLVQGETVVTWSGDQRVEVGDVIRAVDGQVIGYRRQELRPLFAASTDQALEVRIDSSVLAGSEGSIAQLELEGLDGVTRTVGLARTKEHVAPRAAEDKPYRKLPSGLGYIDLTRLHHEQVDEALASVWDSPGIIFDVRGYPHGTAWPISARLTSRPVLAARFRRPEVSPDGGYHAFDQWTPTPIGPGYEGRVVVLIDERAISQAEHTCLFLEATSGATFVGSPTKAQTGT
jgi:C-terminal processing protease CtpA/Prc